MDGYLFGFFFYSGLLCDQSISLQVDLADNRGRTALEIAEKGGHDKIVALLKPLVKVAPAAAVVDDAPIAVVDAVVEKTAPIAVVEEKIVESAAVVAKEAPAVAKEAPAVAKGAPVVAKEAPAVAKEAPAEKPKPVKITDSGVSAELIDMVSKLSENNNKGFSMLHIVSKYNNKEMAGETMVVFLRLTRKD